MAGVEGGAPMRRGDNYGDACFADVEMAKAMDNRNAPDIPGLTHEDADLLQFLQRHCLVSFIDEMQRRLSFRVVADDSFENADRAIFRAQELSRDRLRIDWITSDLIKF